ncbi:MAG: serine/threonine-protein kinase [Planctomycetota bacterium]
MIGEQLGDYRVLARIGSGGFGVVYLAEDTRQHRRVALKVLERLDSAGLKRFGRELETLKRVVHPRIVAPLSPLEDDGERHFFAMELVRGRNLAQVLEELGRLEVSEALRIVSDALEGLACAHDQGVLHRDFKCANLLLDAEGQVKVCDFGLARAVDHTRQTMSQTVLGTPAYLSPEQARGLDARVESDVYGAGVVLYEALTGTLPFRAETPVALLRMHMEDAPDAPSRRRPGLSPELDSLVLRALHKDPDRRFPSAQAMRRELEALRAELAAPPDAGAGLRRLTTSSGRLMEQDAARGQVRRSSGIGAYVAGALVVGAFGFGLLRLTEQRGGLLRADDLAPVGSADRGAALAEVELTGGQRFEGRVTLLADERVRIVCADGVVLEAPAARVIKLRYLGEPAPPGTAPVESGATAAVGTPGE